MAFSWQKYILKCAELSQKGSGFLRRPQIFDPIVLKVLTLLIDVKTLWTIGLNFCGLLRISEVYICNLSLEHIFCSKTYIRQSARNSTGEISEL